MSKTKLITSNLIAILGVMILLLTFQFVNVNKAKAATTTAQELAINLGSNLLIKNGTQKVLTYNLYGNGHNILSYFKFEDEGIYANKADDKNSETYFHLYRQTAAVSSSGAGKTTLTSTITLTNALRDAGINGYLTIKPSASWKGNNSSTTAQIKFLADDTILYDTGTSNNINNQLYTSANYYQVTTNNYYFIFSAWCNGYNFKNNLRAYFYTPSITLTTTDVTAPSISSFDATYPNVWTQSKTIAFTVTDSEAGVDRVEIKDSKGKVVTPSISKSTDTKAATVSFTSSTNNETYTVTAFDNVGNSTTSTYTTNYIDGTAPNVTLSTPSVTFKYIKNAEGVLVPYACFNVALNTPEVKENGSGASSETYYYTINSGETQYTLINGENCFELTQEQIEANTKDFVINIFATDEAGNVQNFDYELGVAYYKYTASKVLRGNNPATIDINSNVLSPQNVTYNYTQSLTQNGVNYELYQVLVNGEVTTTGITGDSESGYTLEVTLDADKNIEIIYREVATVVVKENYDYTGSAITLEVVEGTTCSANDVVFEAIELINLGNYTVSYSIDTENFVGSGEASINIVKKINVEYRSVSLTYDENGVSLDCVIDDGVSYAIEILKSGEVIANFNSVSELTSILLNAGNYTFKLTILDDFTVIKSNDSAELVCDFTVDKKEVLLQSYENAITYNATAFDLGTTYQGYSVDIVYKNSNDEVVTPLNCGNYSITITINEANYSGSTTGILEISQAKLTVTAIDKTSVYGDTLETLECSVVGLLGEDTAEFEVVCNAIDSLNGARLGVGQYDITITERTDLTNYDITYTNAKYTVTPRAVQLEIVSGQTKVYGQTDPELEYVQPIVGLLDGDDLGAVIVRSAGESVGNYEIFLQSWSNKNYDVTCYSANFRITAGKIVIRAPSVTYTYGSVIPQTFEPVIVAGGVSSTQDLGIRLVCNQNGNVGRYEIVMEKTSETMNYEIVYITGFVTITPMNITIKAESGSKVYGGIEPVLTYKVYNSEDVEISGIEVFGVLSRVSGENVGEYDITKGTLTSKNYNITFESAKFTITPATLTIRAENASKIYGENDPILKFNAYNEQNEIVNVKAGDIEGILAREIGENVNEYAILAGTLSSTNYILEFDLENAKFEILPRLAYVVFGDYSQVYGENEPEFVYRTSGVLAGDDLGLTIIRENDGISDVGEYVIDAKISNPNYVIEVAKGTLFIEKTFSTITASNAEFVYDGEEKVPTAVLSVDGEYAYKIVNEQGAPVECVKNAGKYVITFNYAGNQNYYASSTTATYVVKKADASIEILKNIFVENGNIQMPEIKSNCEYIIKFDNAATAAQVGEHAYSIVFADENYNTIRGKLTILAKPSNTTEGGNVEFIDGDVDSEDIDLSIKKTDDSKNAQTATDMKVDSTYEIHYNQSGSATIKVELDYVTDDYTNVCVYVYNDKGEAKLLPYKVVDGKIVLSVDADNMKLAIVKKVTGISIVTIGIIVIIAGLIALNMVRRHKKKKTKRLLKVC